MVHGWDGVMTACKGIMQRRINLLTALPSFGVVPMELVVAPYFVMILGKGSSVMDQNTPPLGSKRYRVSLATSKILFKTVLEAS
jgi:hypothetical protein